MVAVEPKNQVANLGATEATGPIGQRSMSAAEIGPRLMPLRRGSLQPFFRSRLPEVPEAPGGCLDGDQLTVNWFRVRERNPKRNRTTKQLASRDLPHFVCSCRISMHCCLEQKNKNSFAANCVEFVLCVAGCWLHLSLVLASMRIATIADM